MLPLDAAIHEPHDRTVDGLPGVSLCVLDALEYSLGETEQERRPPGQQGMVTACASPGPLIHALSFLFVSVMQEKVSVVFRDPIYPEGIERCEARRVDMPQEGAVSSGIQQFRPEDGREIHGRGQGHDYGATPVPYYRSAIAEIEASPSGAGSREDCRDLTLSLDDRTHRDRVPWKIDRAVTGRAELVDDVLEGIGLRIAQMLEKDACESRYRPFRWRCFPRVHGAGLRILMHLPASG